MVAGAREAEAGSEGAGPPGAGEARGVVTETPREAAPYRLYENVAWQDRFPPLAAGITAAGPDADFGFGTAGPATRFFEVHAALAAQLGFPLGLLVRQVHGARVVELCGAAAAAVEAGGERPADPRLMVAGRADGLVTSRHGVLLAVTAADCVPVYLLDPEAGVLGLLHAGWRGTAAGVLERGVEAAVEAGAAPERLRVHLGPAICGACYEVGPEVPRALGLGEGDRRRVDLRGVLTERAVRLGVVGANLTRSSWCTRCARDRFHSHRGSGSEAGRMAAYLGWRAEAAAAG